MKPIEFKEQNTVLQKPADMTDEEHIQHRIYMRAKRNEANKRKREAFVGPKPKRKLFFVGPPRSRNRRKRSKEYARNKMHRASTNLTDYYVKRRLKKIFKAIGINTLAKNFTPEIVELKRQQLKLWRMTHA